MVANPWKNMPLQPTCENTQCSSWSLAKMLQIIYKLVWIFIKCFNLNYQDLRLCAKKKIKRDNNHEAETVQQNKNSAGTSNSSLTSCEQPTALIQWYSESLNIPKGACCLKMEFINVQAKKSIQETHWTKKHMARVKLSSLYRNSFHIFAFFCQIQIRHLRVNSFCSRGIQHYITYNMP